MKSNKRLSNRERCKDCPIYSPLFRKMFHCTDPDDLRQFIVMVDEDYTPTPEWCIQGYYVEVPDASR